MGLTVDSPPAAVPPAYEVIYDFLSEEEAAYVLSKVDDVGGPEVEEGGIEKASGWKSLNGRRSMYWGGTVTKKNVLIPHPFPPFMRSTFPRLLQRIEETEAFDPFGGKVNHCLVNEYKPGQGIMAHKDGPVYESTVATISLGSHTILSLRPAPNLSADHDPASEPPVPMSPEGEINIFLPERSLLLLSGKLYDDYMHHIRFLEFDSMESLRGCLNWEEYWINGGGEAREGEERLVGAKLEGEAEVAVDNGEEEKDKVDDGLVVEKPKSASREKQDERIKNLVARRRFVESADGWERGRRVSLTVRKVKKVWEGFRMGG